MSSDSHITVDERALKSAPQSMRDTVFRAVFDDARIGIAGALADGRVIICNPAFKKSLGLVASDMLHLRVQDWTEPEDWQKESRLLAMLLAGRIDRYELTKRCRSKTGRVFWSSVTVTAVDHDPPTVLIIAETLNPLRSKEQEALRESELRLAAIFQNTRDGIFLIDDDALYIDVNPAGCHLIGRSREEIVGKSVGSFSVNPDETRRVLKSTLSGEPGMAEVAVLHSDGSTRYHEVCMTPQILPGITLSMARDVTERRELQQQLSQSQKMEAIGRLAGGVAHDFNNMLTVIRGYSELLRKKLPGDSNLQRYAEGIMNAADRSSMITQQLLAFSRRQVIQPQVLDVNRVISDILRLIQRLIGEDIQLFVDFSVGAGMIFADAGQIGQILMNLAVNSRDAMPHGGSLHISTSRVELDQSNTPPDMPVGVGSYVAIAVTDTGCGMSDEVQRHIFEPFFTTKAQGNGTGLGLATVYGIVQQSRGTVGVKSEVGKGSTFTIYLPTVNDEAVDGERRNNEATLV